MFLIPKKFEQTLRASPIQPATPAQPGSGLNPEFHRGCTGKAHACGTLKSRLAANNNNSTHKNGVHTQHQTIATISAKSNPRKNSISSETISDSGSENSASWHSNDSMVTTNGRTTMDGASTPITQKVGGAKPALAKKPMLSAHSKEYAVAMAKALKAVDTPMLSVKRAQSQQRNATARTASPAPTTTSSVSRRMRLHSDGDHSVENSLASSANTSMTAINSAQQSTFERTQKYRSFRVAGRKNTTTANANMNVRPPWNSGAGIRNNNNISIYASHSGNNSSVSGCTVTSLSNRSFRSSLRRNTREALNWQTIWERSLALRSYGANSGVFKNYDEAIKQQPRHGNNTSNDSAHPGLDNGAGNDNADGDAANAANADGERVWLVHRGGFCAALRLPQSSVQRENHKVTIRLLHNGIEMMVDEDDIEKQNSTALDLVEDICDLKQLNEASVLHCLRQRFASNLIHTKAGPTLLVVNPMAPLSLYSEKVVSMFRGCKTEDMPPHIYSLAQTAYRAMLETRRDQSLIFMGRSGSGKTTSFKHALYYLALAAGSYNNFLNAEKVNSINIILEAFGNTKTCLNANATRFTQLLSLDFDQSGQIASASVQVLLPERQRAGRRQPNDHSFHIMGRLLAGAEGLLQKELHLDNISAADNHPFVSLSHKLEERHRAAAEFMRTTQALETLNIEAKAVRGIWSILAAIYHLGLAGVTRLNAGPASRVQFANPSAARRTASLLGVSMEDLTAAAFNATSSGGGGGTSPSKSPNDSSEQAWESLEALAVGLYSEALAAVVALINKAICTSAHTIASIMLVDTPGFQNPASCGLQTGATLSDLRHNYLQERLQLLFHHTTLVAPRDRYAQELVEIDTEGMSETNPGPLVSLIDKAPQNHVVRSSQRDLREHDRRGLLWLLDEESMYPNCNDDTFLERLFTHYGDREHQTLLRKCAGPKQFVLQHLQGTNPVLYTVDGWVRHSREHPAIRNAVTLLQDSSRDEISRLYIGSLTRGAGGIVFCGSIAGLEGTQSLRRVSSIRRSFTSAGVKRNSIMLQVKFTVDGIIDTLRRTGTHFVHCYMLKHNAGQHSSYSSSGSPNAAALQSSCEDMVNIPLLRSQLRGSQVLEAARLHRLGFPESVPLVEFVRRFGLLAAVDSATAKDITVEQILAANEVDTATYRIGPSQVSASFLFFHRVSKGNCWCKTFFPLV